MDESGGSEGEVRGRLGCRGGGDVERASGTHKWKQGSLIHFGLAPDHGIRRRLSAITVSSAPWC